MRAIVCFSRESGQPVIADCPHGGLATAAVPIIVEDIFLGSWIFGQLLIKDLSLAEVERTAEKPGLPVETIGKTIAELPRYSSDIFTSLFAVVGTITRGMVELGRKNMEMARRDGELSRITRQLERRDRFLTEYVEASIDAMYIRDYDTGEILITNQALSRLIGKAGIRSSASLAGTRDRRDLLALPASMSIEQEQ